MRPLNKFTLPALAIGLCLSAFATTPVRAEDPAYITLGAGGWEALRSNLSKPEVDLTFRSDYRLWAFKPQAGVMAAGDGDFYTYAGFLSDIYFGKNIVLTPSLNIGYYGGSGFNLGSRFEFREGAELAYRFDNAYRVGAAFYHMSNAGITDRNPGSESILGTLSIPIGSIFSSGSDQARYGRTPKTAMAQFSPSSNYVPGPVPAYQY